jgi:hypothetical protein
MRGQLGGDKHAKEHREGVFNGGARTGRPKEATEDAHDRPLAPRQALVCSELSLLLQDADDGSKQP